MNAKISVLVICVVLHLLLYNLRDSTFKKFLAITVNCLALSCFQKIF